MGEVESMGRVMMEESSNVTPISPGHGAGSNGGGGDFRKRLIRIETKLEHMATREDIEIKMNYMLRWFLGISLTTIVALILALARILTS